MTTKAERIELTKTENLMHAMAQIRQTGMAANKIATLETEYNKLDAEIEKVRKKNRPKKEEAKPKEPEKPKGR